MLIMIDHRLNAKALGLNANEASVLAAITKCTQTGKGWYADVEALADALEFSVSAKTVSRAVKKLIEMGLVEKRQNVLYERTNCPSSETNCPKIGTNCPSPATPIINNRNMERNENIARAKMHDAKEPTPDSFEKLLEAFTLRVGKIQLADSTRDECLRMWKSEKYPEWKRKMLIARVQSGDWMKPRLDWLIGDFDPKPYDYNHHELPKDVALVSAKFGGSYGIFSADEAESFGMENVKPFNLDE